MTFRVSYVLIPILALWCLASWMWFRGQLKRNAEAEAALPWKHTLRHHLPAESNLTRLLVVDGTGGEHQMFMPRIGKNTTITDAKAAGTGDHATLLWAVYGATESEKDPGWKSIGRVAMTVSNGQSTQYLPLFVTDEGHLGVDWDGKSYMTKLDTMMSAKVRNETP
jgi:hypothetical protein